MTSFAKKILYILAFPLIGFSIGDFCHKQTKGFSVNKITPAFPVNLEEAAALPEEILSVLEQPFHYLKKGNSAYVFISQDENYVIKFLRKPNLFPPFWVDLSPIRWLLPSYCADLIQKKEQQKNILLRSYKLASENLQNQTGIFYSHMNSTSTLKSNITFYDRIKVRHAIPADTTAFFIQKKAIPFCPYFKNLVKSQKKEEIELLLKEFAFLLQERALKGIYDNDISPHYNLGIFKGHFLAFDLDGLKPCEIPSNSEALQKHMLHDGRKMLLWLKSIQKDLAVFLEQEIITLSVLS